MTSLEVLVEISRVISRESLFLLAFHIYTPQESARARSSLSRLLFHDYSRCCSYMRIRKDELEEEISRLKEGQVLGVLSKLLPYYDSIFGPPTIHHLPLMDFNCPVCPENLSRVEEFLAKIGCHGVIMDSGNSYHYYGADLMEEKEWLDFLGNCLLSEFADARYIGHRLKDGCGILRISACPLRPKIPTVVSIL